MISPSMVMQCDIKPTFSVTAPPPAFEVAHCGGRHSQLFEQVKFFQLWCSDREYETRWVRQKFSSRALTHLWDWSQAAVMPCCACTVLSVLYVQQRALASHLSWAVNQKSLARWVLHIYLCLFLHDPIYFFTIYLFWLFRLCMTCFLSFPFRTCWPLGLSLSVYFFLSVFLSLLFCLIKYFVLKDLSTLHSE